MAADRKRFEIFPRRYGFFPYIFLVYLFMPAYYMSFAEGWKKGVGICLLLIFLITYRQLYTILESKRHYTFWLAVQVGIILILSIFYNMNNLFLGFFSAHFIGYYSEKKKFLTALTIFGIVIVLPLAHYIINNIFSSNMFYLVPFIIIMLITPFGIRSMNSRMELEMKLDQANEQIKELVKREERMRIARDLHDTLGHTLSLLTLKSQLVAKLALKDPERASHEAKEMERTSRSALAQVRELVSDMRTITVAEELVEAQAILKAAGISFHLSGDTALKDTPHLTQNILSMCLKEAVTNVVKHSGANHCFVTLRQLEGEVTMTIEDDGKGMPTQESHGNGLKGMGERLELIDGTLQLSTNKGTILVISVPIIVKEREAGVVS